MSDIEAVGKDSSEEKDTGCSDEPVITVEETPREQGGPGEVDDQAQQKSVDAKGPVFEKPFASSTPTLSPATSSRDLSSSYRYKRSYNPMPSYSTSSSRWRSESVMDRIQARATAILDRDMALDRKAKLDGAMEPTSYSATYAKDDDVEYGGHRHSSRYKPQYRLDSRTYRDSTTGSSSYTRPSSYSRKYYTDDNDTEQTSSTYSSRYRSRDTDYASSGSIRSSHSSIGGYYKLKSLLNDEKPSITRRVNTSEITNPKLRGYLKEVENIDAKMAAAMPRAQREYPERSDMYLVTYEEKYVPVNGAGVTEAELEPIRIKSENENITPLISDRSSLYKVGSSDGISDRRVRFGEDDNNSTGSIYLDSVRQSLSRERVRTPVADDDDDEYTTKPFRSRFLQASMNDTRTSRPRSMATDDDADSDDDYYNFGNCRVNTDRYYRHRRNNYDDLDSIMYRYGAYNPRENYAVEDTVSGVSSSYANKLVNRYNRQKELGVYYDRERSADVKAPSISTGPHDIHSRCYHGSTDFVFENRYRLPQTIKTSMRSSRTTYYPPDDEDNEKDASVKETRFKIPPVAVATTSNTPTITITTDDQQDRTMDDDGSEEESFTITETKLERPSHEE